MIINYNSNIIKNLTNNCKINKKGIYGGILGLSLILTGCNRSVLDTKYGFDKALILGDNSSIILDVKQWKDYSGEQIQLTTDNNFVLLTSSFDTNCFYGDSDDYSIYEIASSATESKEICHLTESDNHDTTYNMDIIDTNWRFNKAVTFNGNNALILPINQWKDYAGEQLQVITNDGMTLLLSSYHSKLTYDCESDISTYQFAKGYVGSDGKIVDLSDSDAYSGYNYDIIDTKYEFNKAIIMKEESCVILPVLEWCDYEGEQIQLKIKDGPTIVTAAYDTILINDINSKNKANDIASALSDKVVDLANSYNVASSFNRTLFDLNYGFSNTIFSNSNSSTALKIDKWTDYEGEQLQIKLETGDVILSSSVMMDLINAGTNNLNASELSKMYISDDGKNIDNSNGDITYYGHNKYLLDLQQKFKYALKVVAGNVTIIPLKSWKDFYNTDGTKDTPSSPNCEQLQLVLPDGTAIVTTAYDTLLVDNVTDIVDIAELVRGVDGVITDLTSYVGKPNVDGWNYSFFDTKYYFDYAILNNDRTTQVFPLNKWLDYSDGEQLQLNFNDNTGVLTSFVNVTLVSPETNGIEEVIAAAFSGSLEKDNSLLKVYK